MKTTKLLNLLLLVSILIMGSCNSDSEDDNPNSIKDIPEVLVTTSVSGTVVDEAGEPIGDVAVNVRGASTSTDDFGVFSFSNIELNQNGAVLSIDKEGYFKSTKVVFTDAGQTSTTKIMLIEKQITSSFDASTGGTSTTNDGAKVIFSQNGIKTESGEVYTGTVNVYSTWLDPTADDLSLRMPGDLRGSNLEEEDVKLVTYGMIGVELESDSGEALNIADGQTATIEIPVPSALMSSAPSTIPLWHFDEVTGYWMEEGEATLTNNNTYVGTVRHFSFWNFDIPYEFIHIEGKITDVKQDIVNGLRVEISLDSGETAYGYTNDNGFYEGYVPLDELLNISVYDNCGDEVYNGQIGPFSEDTVIPTISIANTTSFITLTGSLQDCNNDVETNGYVYVYIDNGPSNYIPVNSDGNFNGTISVCDLMEVTVSGISNDPFSQGTSTIFDITGLTELNVGTLVTCW